MTRSFQTRAIGAQVHYDGLSCLFMLKQREAERLINHLKEDLSQLDQPIPPDILSLCTSLDKALARNHSIPLWKSEQDAFAWQYDPEWIQLRLLEKRFQHFINSAITIPRYTANPGHPSPAPERRWPCLSDIVLLVQMMPAMHRRQGILPGRTSTLEISDVFCNEDLISDKL